MPVPVFVRLPFAPPITPLKVVDGFAGFAPPPAPVVSVPLPRLMLLPPSVTTPVSATEPTVWLLPFRSSRPLVPLMSTSEVAMI